MITEEIPYDFKKTKELQEQAINLTPYRIKVDSTLKAYDKDKLIELLRMVEQNYFIAEIQSYKGSLYAREIINELQEKIDKRAEIDNKIKLLKDTKCCGNCMQYFDMPKIDKGYCPVLDRAVSQFENYCKDFMLKERI